MSLKSPTNLQINVRLRTVGNLLQRSRNAITIEIIGSANLGDDEQARGEVCSYTKGIADAVSEENGECEIV